MPGRRCDPHHPWAALSRDRRPRGVGRGGLTWGEAAGVPMKVACRWCVQPRADPWRDPCQGAHTWQTAGAMGSAGILVVLRGNSGSGKSTVARMLQQRFDRGTCLIVEQDRVRREMLRERDIAGALNIQLIEAIATFGPGSWARGSR